MRARCRSERHAKDRDRVAAAEEQGQRFEQEQRHAQRLPAPDVGRPAEDRYQRQRGEPERERRIDDEGRQATREVGSAPTAAVTRDRVRPGGPGGIVLRMWSRLHRRSGAGPLAPARMTDGPDHGRAARR